MSSASVTDVSITSTVAAGASTTTETSTSTFTSDSSTFTTTAENTSTSSTIVSTVIVSPSTTYVAAATTSQSFVAVTSTITESPSAGDSQTRSIVIVTSTEQPLTQATTSTPSTTATNTSASSTPSTLSASGSSSNGSSGLSTGATIAIAVVIPIVAIALAFCLGLFFWRRRKEKKQSEEQRKNEIEEYGFNPNQDPSLATAAYAETGSEMAEDNSGYRGWGTTSNVRNAPTTLGSGSRGAALGAMSESSSNVGGGAYQHTASLGHGSDGFVSDNPVHNGEGVGAGFGAATAAGTVGAAATRRQSGNPNIHRGPSNASSAYSIGPTQSELSGDEIPGGAAPAPYYHEEGPYNYIDAQAQHGPYGDGTYGANGQPVVRNVQARRNTRIERAPANSPTGGIAQNF